jgi:hypothetical protein
MADIPIERHASLNTLVGSIRESIERYQRDPEAALQSVLGESYLSMEESLRYGLGELEKKMHVVGNMTESHHRAVGNLLLAENEILTQEQLDALFDSLVQFGKYRESQSGHTPSPQ